MSELISERSEKRAHLEALETFLAGPVYRGWQAARAEQQRQVEEALLELDPTDRKSEIESYKLRGERRLLQDLQNQFEDVRETLKSRLDEIEELLQPNTAKDKTE